MIPGSNILLAALTQITPQELKIYRFAGRTKNTIGQWVTSYAPAETILGSVQAVPRSVYQNIGLDYQKNYMYCFMVGDFSDIKRGESGDQMEYGGKRWQFLSEADWSNQDGWVYELAVEVENA